MNKNKIVLIGAGNVAYHLAPALHNKGFEIIQIYNRTLAPAREIAHIIGINKVTDDIRKINKKADIYLFCVKDDALPELLKNFPTRKGLFIHTAGSVAINVFKPYAEQYGVLYPLQTFSKKRPIFFGNIPLFIEGNTTQANKRIETMARLLSFQTIFLSSEKRQRLHLAAVFANNFTNHLYDIAADLVEEQGLDWQLLTPLIDETADKLRSLTPRQSQTGPAIRNDKSSMRKHLKLLENKPKRQEIYTLLSQSIKSKKE